MGHPLIKPKSIGSGDVLEAYARDYTYLGCVQFVKQARRAAPSRAAACGPRPARPRAAWPHGRWSLPPPGALLAVTPPPPVAPRR